MKSQRLMGSVLAGLVGFGLSSNAALAQQSSKQSAQQNSIAVLQYHHVADDTPAVTSITPEQFAQHLDYLDKHDYQVLAISEAKQRLESGQDIPEKAVVITFDDGYKNVYDNAADLLADYQFPYTVFVNPALLEQSPSAYMSWEQLRDIQQRGATIANHGQTHDHLIRRHKGESEKQWQQRMQADVVGAQQAIDEHLGAQEKYFAYPYGEFNPALEQLLEQWGFLGFAQHSGPWSQYSDRTAITRFPASGRYANLETLKVKLNSKAMPVSEYSPKNPVLATEQSRPTLQVTLAHTKDVGTHALQCFAGSEVLTPSWSSETQFSVTPAKDLPIGRSRINCTAPSNSQNQYYWFSAAFIRPDSSGQWPD